MGLEWLEETEAGWCEADSNDARRLAAASHSGLAGRNIF